MSIMVKDVFRLESLKEMKMVAGGCGMEKYIDWIYVAECFDDPLESIKWLQGGEIVFVTGARMKGDLTYITKMIKGLSEKNSTALMINIGPYIESIPQEAIDEANKLEIPLFTVPWSTKLIDISKEITNEIILSTIEEKSLNHFLSNILFGNGENSGDAIKKAAYFGYDLEGNCSICVIDIDKFQVYLEKRNIFEEEGILKVKNNFKRIVQDTLKIHGFKVPIIDKDDSLILFLKDDKTYMSRINKVLLEIKENIKKEMDNVTVSIGIGGSYSKLKVLKESFREAELAIKYLKCNGYDDEIESYNNIGEYQLLFNISDDSILERYYYGILGNVLEADKKGNDITSIRILETYLEEDCNVTNTAERLFLHRNTLKYRIKKIECLLNCDLRNFNQCSEIKLAIDIGKVLSKK